ncbi:MAG: CdaR family protein [Acidobacteriota bacterium]|nr:CdaR family protein [Acidobacteriota bacterium]
MLKDLLTRNWSLKLLAFGLAVILWITLVPKEKTFGERTLAVSLETRNIPPTMELVEKSVSVVDVTVQATNRLLSQITTNDLTAVLDLKNALVGQDDYALDASMVVVPPNVKAVRVFPPKARIKLEQANETEMEVVPAIQGTVKSGFRIESFEVAPSRVRVRGPASKFRPRDTLRTGPVDVTGLAAPVEVETDILLPRPDLRILGKPAKARVRVTISKK